MDDPTVTGALVYLVIFSAMVGLAVKMLCDDPDSEIVMPAMMLIVIGSMCWLIILAYILTAVFGN